MKRLEDYYDQNKLLCTLEPDGSRDGGDTCANQMTAAYNSKVRGWNVSLFAANLVRHPDASKWYGNKNTFSRDQFRPLLYAIGVNSKHYKASRGILFKAHLKNLLLFTWNTRRNFQYPTLEEHLQKSTPDVKWNYSWKLPDFTGPEVWASWIRAYGFWLLYPALLILDLQLLLTSLLELKSTDTDVRCHALACDYHARVMPTPLSLLAKWILTKTDFLARLDKEYSEDRYPPINELIRKLYE